MMHIFIFNNASRAANYGIGSYVRLLADGLLGRSGVKVSFVDMFSDVKEYWPGISRRRMMSGWCSISAISSISRLPLC